MANPNAAEDGKLGGRPKGSQNKINREVKDMLREALDNSGGAAYFTKQAAENPNAFMALIGKAFITEKTQAENTGTLTIKWETDGGNSYTLRAAQTPTDSARES